MPKHCTAVMSNYVIVVVIVLLPFLILHVIPIAVVVVHGHGRHRRPLVTCIGRGEPRSHRRSCTYNCVLLFPSTFPRRRNFPLGRRDRHQCHHHRPMEEWSGFPRQLWQLMEVWRLVCGRVLWHVPSKINKGSEFRVSVSIHLVQGYTGNCGNTPHKKLLKILLVTDGVQTKMFPTI